MVTTLIYEVIEMGEPIELNGITYKPASDKISFQTTERDLTPYLYGTNISLISIVINDTIRTTEPASEK